MNTLAKLGAAAKSQHPLCHIHQAHKTGSTETKLVNPMGKKTESVKV